MDEHEGEAGATAAAIGEPGERRRGMPVPPPYVAAAAWLAQDLLSRRAVPRPATTGAAIALAAGALALGVTSIVRFRVRRTTIDPVDPTRASALVTDGPYRITRNPMYVGMAGVLAAHALHRRSLLAVAPVPAFVAVIDRLQIPGEEAALTASFGDAYAAFRARVPRWLGPVGPRR